MSRVGEILKSYLTAPDGVSYAPGRLMGFTVFFLGQGITVYVTVVVGMHVPPSAVSDWVSLLVGLSAWEGAICATSIGLVLGMAPTDAGGKFWDKNSSGPPAVTNDPPQTPGKGDTK